MTGSSFPPESLPPLDGELSRKDLLRHYAAGNVLGGVVLYNELDVELFKAAQLEPGGLGKAVVEICESINVGMPEHDMELGTDFYFRTPDEEDDSTEMAGEDGGIVSLSPEDVEYLLKHMPTMFLDQVFPKV